MSPTINAPLETYLLAQLAEPIACLVCEEENSSNAERCCRCATPIALARQAAPSKRFGASHRPPHLIAVIGAPGAGKTVYLGMLMDMLVRGVGGLRATLRGALSIDIQQAATTPLSCGMYPEKTSIDPEHWRWSHCRIECSRQRQNNRRRATEIIVADIAGDAWVEETNHPGCRPAIPGLLQRASAVMVLADAQRLHGGDHSDNFTTLKLLSTMEEHREPHSRWRRPAKPPLAVVLTKGDGCQTVLDDPTGFAEAHAEAMLRDCQARLPNTRVFGASVAGASAWRKAAGRRRNVPLRVEPQGVVEPLGWLLTQLN